MRQPSFLTLTKRKMSEVSGKRVIITVVLPKMLLTVIAPVTQDFTTKGYLHDPSESDEINALQNALLQRVYIALIIIYLLSFMIFLAFEPWYTAHWLRSPRRLHSMHPANQNYEIPIRTSDEMGYLSAFTQLYVFTASDMENYQKKFVAICLHDFRSPLTSIKGYIEPWLWYDSCGNAEQCT